MHTLATVHWLRGLSIKREDTKLRCIWRSWRGDAGIQIYDYISLNIFAFLKNEKNTKLIWQLYPRWFIFYWVTSCTRWANTIQLFSFLPSRLFFFSMNSEKKNDLPILLALNLLSLNLSDHHDDESGHILPSLDVYNSFSASSLLTSTYIPKHTQRSQ